VIPAVTFVDPESALVDMLKAAFVGRSEPYRANTISTSYPASSLTSTRHIQVELENGDVSDYPVTERVQVRFTCHAPSGKRSDVKNLASLTMALVATLPVDDSAGCFIRGGRSAVSTDPDTKNLMCWFLAEVPLLATPLS
jgi:hypothetical protein